MIHRIIILAAGKGTRMNSDKPKVLIEVGGRTMIERLLDSVIAAGVDQRPIVVASPENIWQLENSLKNYNVEFVIQEQQLGTGHAVACALNAVSSCGKVLVFNGDHSFVSPASIGELAASESGITLLVAKVDDFSDWRTIYYHWGRVIRAERGIKAIVEFKDADDATKEIKEVNPAMYAFDFEWLKDNINRINTDNAQKEFYLTDLIALAFAQEKKIESIFISPKEAIGINSKEELEIAESLL